MVEDGGDLSRMKPDGADCPVEGGSVSTQGRTRIAAQEWAIRCSDDEDLPARFRKKAHRSARRGERESEKKVEERFQKNVDHWQEMIERMLATISAPLAWRFINCSPRIAKEMNSVTQCDDFCQFIDYLILRRDTERCDADELGRLARLIGSFQREIEKHLRPEDGRIVG